MRLVALAFVAVAALAVGGHALASSVTPKITKFRRGLSGFPISITAGPKRSLWFTESVGPSLRGGIGQITTGGRIREYRNGISGHMYAGTASIVVGRNGDIWFSESGARTSFLGRMTPGGTVREFRTGIRGTINDLTVGPDGNVWFTEVVSAGSRARPSGAVGRITSAGAITVFTHGIHAAPEAITAGSDGNLWFTENAASPTAPGAMARITPAGMVTEFSPPSPFNTADLTVGADGNLWYSDSDKIVRVSTRPDGRGGLAGVRSFSIGRPDGYVHAITAGPDGALWFAAQNETGYTKLGRITTTGRVTRFANGLGSTRGSFLDGIAVGPDRNIWFTEAGRSSQPAIDRLSLHH